MPRQDEQPRPHGDPLEKVIRDKIPHGEGTDSRNSSDRVRGHRSSASGVPEFDEDAGKQRRKQFDEGAEIVSGID